MRKVFQDKIKIENKVSYEKHGQSVFHILDKNPKYNGSPQTLASYSYHMTRLDFLRIAEAIMKDYQNKTCVGNYLSIDHQMISRFG